MKESVTFVLLNWRRPHNLIRVIESIRAQTIPSRIFIWNNNGNTFENPNIEWQVVSSRNRYCWSRWLMASMADTEYIATLDDDICFRDERVLSDAVDYHTNLNANQIIGPFGAILPADLNYRSAQMIDVNSSLLLPYCDRRVDIIKGRHMLLRRTALLENMRLPGAPIRADDILISAAFSGGTRMFHVCPSIYFNRFTELPSPHALHTNRIHCHLRSMVSMEAFGSPARAADAE